MTDVFAKIVLGHLTGDYLLQSKAMALNKSKKGWRGFAWCVFHCVTYTAAVSLFLWTVNPLTISLIFASHFVVDRWSLATVWLKFIRGRDFASAYLSKDQHREFDIAFTCLVYTVADNTIHLISLWLIAML